MEQVGDISIDCIDENLPTVEERWSALRPSRQLLEFYRRKVEELEREHDSLSVKLDGYSKVCDQEVQLERTIRQREKEIADLQKALSDLQVFLLKEREQNLRLFSENDKLRIRELEDRKTMQHLITIAGPAVAECSYFHKQPPNIVVIKEHKAEAKYKADTGYIRKISADTADSGFGTDEFEPRRPVQPTTKGAPARNTGTHFQNFRVENKNSKGPSQERINDDKQILALQTDALRAQLEETVKLSGDQVNQLMEDRRIMLEEHETLRKRESERSDHIENRLRKTQELLRDTTKEFLQSRKSQREKERHWLQEKDKLLQQLDRAHDRIFADDETKSPTKKLLEPPTKRDYTILEKPTIDPEVVKKLKRENAALKERLEQAVHLSDMYREQCINAEEESGRIRDEIANNQTIFKSRTSKLVDKLELTTKRYGSLEKRRGFEIEGYNTEIRKLKERCDQLEHQLFKISAGGLDDIEVLQNFKESASRSRALQSQIKSIKKKLYDVESNFRHAT